MLTPDLLATVIKSVTNFAYIFVSFLFLVLVKKNFSANVILLLLFTI